MMKLSKDTWTKVFIVLACVAISILLANLVAEQFWVLALLPFFLLPAFRRLGWLEDLDERARRHTEQSSNIAFLVLLLMLMILEIDGYLLDERAQQGWAGIIILAVLVKLFAYAAMNFRPRTSGFLIGLLCGTFWLWFIIASHWGDFIAIAIESVFALVILLATFLGRRWQVQGAIVLIMLAFALCIFPIMNIISTQRLSTGFFLLALLPTPPALAGGFYLYDHFSYEKDDDEDK
jgi:MFS family permease